MISKITFTVKGDYSEMSLGRDEGSQFVDMEFHRHGGCSYATFKFEDLKKAVEILSAAEEG